MIRNTITPCVLFALLISFDAISAQPKFTVFTPDSQINRQIANRAITELDFLVYREGTEGLTIDPVLPAGWSWVAGKGVTSKGERIEFFFRDGHFYANRVDVTSFRSRDYPDIFTDFIESNVFTIGIRKYDEAMIFVATDEPKDVSLIIHPRVFGQEKQLRFHLGKNQSQLIRIFPMEPPYRP